MVAVILISEPRKQLHTSIDANTTRLHEYSYLCKCSDPKTNTFKSTDLQVTTDFGERHRRMSCKGRDSVRREIRMAEALASALPQGRGR